jgi:pantoate--beta-alanine ligase
MGALHDGHLSLVRRSLEENDLTVASIFVNPIQFNDKNDLEKYPRNNEEDRRLLEQAGCDILFLPPTVEIYPSKPNVKVGIKGMDSQMEGKFRQDHFSGVAVVVLKLFNIILPHRAYFGQKDYQQYKIIDQLAKDLSYDIQVKMAPTVREESGLAMSSRNKRLGADEKLVASELYRSLKLGATELKKSRDVQQVKEVVREKLQSTGSFEIDYFEIADADNLTSLEAINSHKRVVLCAALHLGNVRLIDNMIVEL